MYRYKLTVFKVELVKVHALHQVPQGLGFKRGESRITNPPGREKEVGEKAKERDTEKQRTESR